MGCCAAQMNAVLPRSIQYFADGRYCNPGAVLCQLTGSAVVVSIIVTLLFTGLMLRRVNIGITKVFPET